MWEGDGHSAPRAPPVSGARLVQVKRAAGLACVGPGDRRHSMVGGQVESESLCLSVWRSFLALCLSVSVGVCRSGGRTWSSGSMSSVVILSVWWSCVVGGGLGRAGRRSARLCRWPGSAPRVAQVWRASLVISSAVCELRARLARRAWSLCSWPSQPPPRFWLVPVPACVSVSSGRVGQVQRGQQACAPRRG